MTLYGLNPSFCTWTSRLPLFADAIRRGRAFELFDPSGLPLSTAPALGPDGWPVEAPPGLSNGVRAFGDMGGRMATINIQGSDDVKIRTTPSSATITWQGGGVHRAPLVRAHAGDAVHGFSTASIAALARFKPTVLRTLDWSRANEGPSWARPRVLPTDPLQGTDRGMAIELQRDAANLLKAALWWNAPPRYSLTTDAYEARLSQLLAPLRDARQAPILELGNELWNDAFPVHDWLAADAAGWQVAAAREIATLTRVADRVLGPQGSAWYLFVGGQLAVPSHLEKVLGALRVLRVTPNAAGPALYVTPLKVDKDFWDGSQYIPTQGELSTSCDARLFEIAGAGGVLQQHAAICGAHGIAKFACYEAGQSLMAGPRPWRAAALAAQREAWMGDLYRRIRATAEAAGVDLLNWYSACTNQEPTDPRVDVFGLLEGTDYSLLPKAVAAIG